MPTQRGRVPLTYEEGGELLRTERDRPGRLSALPSSHSPGSCGGRWRFGQAQVWDFLLQILSERGAAHEQDYIEHLTKAGLDVARIDGVEVTNEAAAETLAAMRRGIPVIVQGALSDQGWNGRADILRRVEVPSAWGGWSYEAIDTKLARETKAGTILQLCLYSDLLATAQDLAPEYMYVVAPWLEFEPQQYRFADYAAYFRKVKRALLTAMLEPAADDTYPDPIEHCDICRWREACDKRRRDDDHLCLVAGISKLQINELKAHGVATVQGLAAAKAMDVKRACIPNRATKSPEREREQKKRWFRNGQKWRTGCEGRISVAKRRHGLDRHNELGVPVFEIGAQRFICIGTLPPFDHPHVFLNMGGDHPLLLDP